MRRRHEQQLKVFFVGGPNQRKDFHLEEGEELFYMKKGTMELIVQEKNAFKTIVIQEGEVRILIPTKMVISSSLFFSPVYTFKIFLLPGKITHSPQRKADTIGLVIERERAKQELDCLRYFVDGTSESLFERWFYCDDLGVQLVPVIKEFFASEQCRTGRPLPGTIPENPPYHPDPNRQLENPFNLKDWLKSNHKVIQRDGQKRLFDRSTYHSDVIVYGTGVDEFQPVLNEIWLWQLVLYYFFENLI